MPNWCYNTLEVSGFNAPAVLDELGIHDKEGDPYKIVEF